MYTVTKNTKLISYALMAIGVIAMIVGFTTDPHRAWPSLLINNYFFLAIAAFSIFFVALQYVSEAGWATPFKRVAEAISSYFLVYGIIMLFLIVAGIMHWHHIYHWMETGITDPLNEHYDAIIAGKSAYLNGPFFFIRACVYIFGWWYASKRLIKLSRNEERDGGTVNHFKSITVSAVFIGFFGYTSSMMAWDWIMSIDSHWFSTLFGWFVFSSMGVTGFTAIAILAIYLKRKGYLEQVNDNHIHDLGKWIFSFSILWTYMWFSQFMLIWYADIPEETTYFVARFTEYKLPFIGMVVMNFVFPVLLLINSDFKSKPWFVFIGGTVILLGHYIDVFVMVMPSTVGAQWSFGIPEISALFFFIGLFIYSTFSAFAKANPIAKGNPFLKESEHFHYYNIEHTSEDGSGDHH